MDFFATAIEFLFSNAVVLGAVAALIGLVEKFLKPFRYLLGLRKKPDRVDLGDETLKKLAPKKPEDGPQLTVAEFLRLRREMKADLEAELAQAKDAEKAELTARIAELQSQIANPDKALSEARARIAELEARLDRMGNRIGGDRLNEAKAALERLDYSLADEIFAEIEARQELEVQEAARAVFGRGEVAEAEIRWADAARHYARAARLQPDYDSLYKASEFSERAGEYEKAHRFSEELVDFARAHETQERLSNALNEHALNSKALGRFEAAEALFRQAMEIDKATIGEGHPDYATRLNNLAVVLEDQGRFDEAKALYRQALEIGKATIGEGHPDYATRLSNLALVLKAQGRLDEAEALYRQALEIGTATIGEGHPDYAIRLNNLAGVLEAQGQSDAAKPLYQQALAVFEATLPPGHPHIAAVRDNLDTLTPPAD